MCSRLCMEPGIREATRTPGASDGTGACPAVESTLTGAAALTRDPNSEESSGRPTLTEETETLLKPAAEDLAVITITGHFTL